jgi:hypothetical protein
VIDGNLAKALVREAMLRTYIGKEVTLLMPGGVVYAGELQEPVAVEPASADTKGLNRWVLRIKRQIVGKGQPTIMPQMTLEFTAFDDVMVSIFEESQEEALDKLKAEQAAQPAKGRLIVPGGN